MRDGDGRRPECACTVFAFVLYFYVLHRSVACYYRALTVHRLAC